MNRHLVVKMSCFSVIAPRQLLLGNCSCVTLLPYVLYICVALISYIHVTMHYSTTVHPTHMARIVPTTLLHFLHPWRSDVESAEYARINLPPWTYALQNFAIALLLRAFHALNQNILTDNLFDPDLIRGSLTREASASNHFFPARYFC